MPQLNSFPVVALGAVLSWMAAVSAEIKPLEGWRAMRSANFYLLGDVGESELRRVASRLEQFREAVGVILPRATVTAATPTTVVVFRSHKGYRPFKPVYQGKPMDHIAGYFQPGAGANFVTLTTESRGADPDEALRIVYHELVHLMVNNSTRGVPAWFNEGLAEYYRMLDISSNGRKVVVGRIHADHVLLLREQFIPLTALIAVDHGSPLYNEASKASIFYAESWALVHYLSIGDVVRNTARTGALLKALTEGDSFAVACQKALGLSVEQLEKELRAYVRRDSFTSLSLTLSERLDAIDRLPAAPIRPASVHATMATVMLSMERTDEARAHAEFAVASDPANVAALTALGVLLAREGKVEAARAQLEKAAAAPDATALTHLQLAQALLKAPDAARSAESSLRKAIAMDPTLADAHAELARLLFERAGSGREPLDLMQKAIALAPGRDDYVFNFGSMLANRGAFADARTILTPLSVNASRDEIRSSSRSLLDRIEKYEKRLANEGAGAGAPNQLASGPTMTVPAFRAVQPGEQQVFGLLQAIECPRGLIRLVVEAEGALTRVHSTAFDRIDFISYRNDLTGSISCGARTAEHAVLVTYRPGAHDGSVGEVVAVEFVPAGYRPMKNAQ